MTFDFPPIAVENLLRDMESKLHYARNIGNAAEVKPELFELYDRVEAELTLLKTELELKAVTMTYTNALANSLNKLAGQFSAHYGTADRKPFIIEEEHRATYRDQQERKQDEIELALLAFHKTRDFFSKIEFLNKGLVIVGANGSGKTFLANSLLGHARNNGVVVAARRILYLPQFDTVPRLSITEESLKNIQVADKSNRLLGPDDPGGEFAVLIQYLLASDSQAHKEYKRKASESTKQGISIAAPDLTKLEKALEIWNSLYSPLELFIDDEMNLQVRSIGQPYSANAMSDGEKVALFLIAHVLATPQKGFIIVDEPEMYLHPTIHKRLWDTLETERPDSIFIYLTHDLEFAVSRSKAKKLWLKSYEHSNRFELEEIVETEIPQSLLLELLGTRQDILFCEGEVGKLDERIYKILFPNYLVRPVESYRAVINYTKAYNKLPMTTRRAIGIVDGDFISDARRESLIHHQVFCIDVPDVENLLLDPAVLNAFVMDNAKVFKIKSAIIDQLKKDLNFQVSAYVSAKVEHFLKDNNVTSGAHLDELKTNFQGFLQSINIDSWAEERRTAIKNAVSDADYEAVIRIFKNKGLYTIIESKTRVKDFTDKAITLIVNDPSLKAVLKKHIHGL